MRRSIIVTMFMAACLALPGCTEAPKETTAAPTAATTTAAATTEVSTAEVTSIADEAVASQGTDEDRDPAADTAAYKAGTYTASAKGYGGDVTVTVTVDKTKITAVSAEGPDETDGIGTKALAELPDMILAGQSSKVDGVAGATVTSKAITEALEKALEAAKDQS